MDSASTDLPDGFDEINPDRSVTSIELAELNAVAVEHRHFCMSKVGIDALDPSARHVGTIVLTTGGVAPAEGHGGSAIRSDAWVVVCWILSLRDGGQAPGLMGCRASAYFGLDEGTVPDEHRIPLHNGAMANMREAAKKGMHVPTHDGGRARLAIED